MAKKIYKVRLGDSDGDDELFKKIRSKLLDAIDQFLDTPIDYQTGSTIKDETKEFASLTLDFAKNKLRKAGIENHKLLSEIDEKYSAVERNKGEARKANAEARKLNIEARRLEFDQRIKELSMKLKFSKALIIGREGKEAVILTKEIDSFLHALEAMKENTGLLE